MSVHTSLSYTFLTIS